MFIFDESLRAATLYRNMVTSYLNYVNKDGHAFTKSYIKAMIDEELAKENVSLELQKNFIDKVIRKGLRDGDFQLNMTCDCLLYTSPLQRRRENRTKPQRL